MAGRGPAPKPAEQRRRRNADPVATIALVDDGRCVGPTLADATGREDWPAPVARWWDVWQTSPQAKHFLETDWSRLALVAYLVERYLSTRSSQALSEIRLNEERLGATIVDRQRARMALAPAEAGDGEASVSVLAAYRDVFAEDE